MEWSFFNVASLGDGPHRTGLTTPSRRTSVFPQLVDNVRAPLGETPTTVWTKAQIQRGCHEFVGVGNVLDHRPQAFLNLDIRGIPVLFVGRLPEGIQVIRCFGLTRRIGDRALDDL